MGMSGQRHAPTARFTPRERTPGTHWIGGWAVPRAGLVAGARRKILCPCRGSNLDHPIVQPVGRHYTVWATTAHILINTSCIFFKDLSEYRRDPILNFSYVVPILQVYTSQLYVDVDKEWKLESAKMCLSPAVWCSSWVSPKSVIGDHSVDGSLLESKGIRMINASKGSKGWTVCHHSILHVYSLY
jgi:hypothetical protein